MTHRLLHLAAFASKGQQTAKQANLKRRAPSTFSQRRPSRLWDNSARGEFQLAPPVPSAQSAGPTGWTPVSWWTPASPAGFWSRSAPRLRRCWPTTWPASVGTSPGCDPESTKYDTAWLRRSCSFYQVEFGPFPTINSFFFLHLRLGALIWELV